MSIKLYAAATLAALCLQSYPAAAQQSGNASPITFGACNHTSNDVLVAVSYIPVDRGDVEPQWRNVGWTRITAGQCTDLLTTANGTFYARAEVSGDSNQNWGTDINQCVEYPGPYDFWTTSSSTSCPEGTAAMFTTFHSDGSPHFTWNLNP